MIITVWIALVPALILYLKTSPKVFSITVAISLALGAMFIGNNLTVLWVSIAVFLLIPAVVMAESYRRQFQAKLVIRNGIITCLSLFLIVLMLSTWLGFDMNRSVTEMIQEGMASMPTSFQDLFTEITIAEVVKLAVMMIPFYLIATSFLLTVFTHGIARMICNRTGTEIPGLKPIREWKLKRSFVWIYLIALLIDLFIVKETGSFLTTAIVNLVPIMTFVFVVQGISFLFFVGYTKRRIWIPWVGIVALILMSPIMFTAMSLLGVFDTAFPLRDRIRKS